MFASENLSRNHILRVAIPVTCFFLVPLSWNSLGAIGNKIPKLPKDVFDDVSVYHISA